VLLRRARSRTIPASATRAVKVKEAFVPLSLQSRRVGDITVVTCAGGIVEGAESTALKEHFADLLFDRPYVVLDLGEVAFVDSSGLGLLVRLLNRTRTSRGDLKLCAVRAPIAEVLRVTRLGTIFESYATAAEAIAAFYQPSRLAETVDRFKTDILCVDPSDDVLVYLHQLLSQGGYGVLTASNLPDARILLTATQPKLLIVGAGLSAAMGTRTVETVNGMAAGGAVIQLPDDFSHRDAGEAGRDLLAQVALYFVSGSSVTST
jgi:anti-sigma B factor antagonist